MKITRARGSNLYTRVGLGAVLATTVACQGTIDGVGERFGESPRNPAEADGGGDGGGGIDPAADTFDPGRVVLRRLNRAEYNNTVSDLFGQPLYPADALPEDPFAHGFDNVAAALSVSPLAVQQYERIAGELAAAAVQPPLRSRIASCEPEPGREEACLRQVIETFGLRAWRRPLQEGEVAELLQLLDVARQHGEGYEAALELVIKALLLAPNFLFRVEPDPEPQSLEPRPLDDYALASRLSYFLWSSMPDDVLFAAASEGSLQDPDVLEQQVRRMLDDPRAAALVQRFAGQWLHFDRILDTPKDLSVFPEYTPELQLDFQTELELSFGELLAGRGTLYDLVTGDFTFVNPRLAAFYGLPEPDENEFVKTSWGSAPRRGLITSAGLMSVLSGAVVNKPVVRGMFVLESLLCLEPPPPPPDISTDLPENQEDLTLRELLAAHRAQPECAVCHNLMDPLGLAFENYDAIGRFRTEEAGFPVDATGEYPATGEPFQNAVELADILADDPRLIQCASEKMFTYALGRKPMRSDAGHLVEIDERFVAAGLTLPELVVSVVMSKPFLMRRGEEETF